MALNKQREKRHTHSQKKTTEIQKDDFFLFSFTIPWNYIREQQKKILRKNSQIDKDNTHLYINEE